jgi:hypothetical protein
VLTGALAGQREAHGNHRMVLLFARPPVFREGACAPRATELFRFNEKKEEATMKTLKWILLVVLGIGVSVSTVMLRKPPVRQSVADANERSQFVERKETVAYKASPLTEVPFREETSPAALSRDSASASVAAMVPAGAAIVRVGVDRVLAKVNNQAVLLKDLVPLQPDEREHAMTAEEYESRLNRAIEMELTFRAAAVQGVTLTAEQQKRVSGIARKHDATFQDYKKQGMTWSSVTPAQVEFEQRLTSALLLQQNLVAMEAHVAPSADASVQARYEHARSEVLSRLKANGNISLSIVEL